MFNKATSLLKKDVVLKPIVVSCKSKVEERWEQIQPNPDLYFILIRSIVSQQLSIKAASTIFDRFLCLFPKKYPNAKKILKLDNEKLRAAGLSYQKASYIKAVATYALTHDLTSQHIDKLSNEEIILELTAIKGVGKWTVEMILIFGLKRPDVFPYDDLIVKNRIITLYHISSKGKQLKTDCHQIAEHWKPYRSIASLFLWESKNL